jgi:hypothetical protein
MIPNSDSPLRLFTTIILENATPEDQMDNHNPQAVITLSACQLTFCNLQRLINIANIVDRCALPTELSI